MANSELDQVWDVDLMKQQLAQLREEVRQLKQELLRAKKAGEKRWRDEAELRRLVQDGHLRERHLKSRYRELSDLERHECQSEAIGAPRPGMHPASGASNSFESRLDRVDPSIVDRIAMEEVPVNGWPTPESILPVLQVHPGWGNYASMGQEGAVIGMSLLGLEATERARVIALVSSQQLRNPNLFPVFITDVDDFADLRAEHFVFEYLPPWPGEGVVPSAEKWEEFLLERLALIRRKWGIRRFISFHGDASGRNALALLGEETMDPAAIDATEK